MFSALTDVVIVFLRDMLDAGVVDDRPYAALVSAYGKAGLMDHVDRVLQTMESSGVEAGTALFNTLINIHSKAENPEKALAVMRLMQANGELGCFYNWLIILLTEPHEDVN